MWIRSVLHTQVIDLECRSGQLDTMWIDVKSREARNALVQDYVARKKRRQTRFETEKLGEVDLFTEAAKLLKPSGD